ncbi:MAG: deaminase, partial [Christensenellaceae bacterium]
SEKLGGWRLIDCDLYVTMEPCIMCSGAIVNSRIKKLIIGTKHIKNMVVEKQYNFKIDYFKDNNVEVYFDVLNGECSTILNEFFKTLRKR